MIRRRLLLAGHTAFLFLLFLTTCNGRDCPPASCGNLRNISYPFRLLTDPKECGDQRYTLSCESSSTVLYLYSGKYYVQEINYVNFTIRLVDAGIDEHDCFTAPQFPLTKYNFSTEDPYSWYKYKWIDSEYQPRLSKLIIFINCVYPVNSSLYVDTASCNNNFPYWVHDEVSGGEFVAAGDSTENSNEIAKKMVVVGLWCIQMKPNDRPAMNKVIQMLEGDLESLQLPPRPVLYPQETLVKDIGKEVSSLSPTFSESISSLTE